MSARLFSINSLNGKVQAPADNSAEMAADLAMDTIEGILNQREAAKAAEVACEPPLPWTPVDQERIDTLEALMKGRHRATVLPLILEAFPELVGMGKIGQA